MGNVAIALLANTLATGAMLVTLISHLGQLGRALQTSGDLDDEDLKPLWDEIPTLE
jgi:hypothetical protein